MEQRSFEEVVSLAGVVVLAALTALTLALVSYTDLVIYVGLISVFVHAVSQAVGQLYAAIESLGASCDAALVFVLAVFSVSLATAGDALARDLEDGGMLGADGDGSAWYVYVVGASHISMLAVGLSPVLLFVPRYGFNLCFAQQRFVAAALRVAGSPAVRYITFSVYCALVLLLLSNAYACFQLLREAGLAAEEVVLFLVLYAILLAATFTAAFERMMNLPLAPLLQRAATLPLLRALRYETVLRTTVSSNVPQLVRAWADEAVRRAERVLAATAATARAALTDVPFGRRPRSEVAARQSAALLLAASEWRGECAMHRLPRLAAWTAETARAASDPLSVVHRAVLLDDALRTLPAAVGAARARAIGHVRAEADDDEDDGDDGEAHGHAHRGTLGGAARELAQRVEAALEQAQLAARTLGETTERIAHTCAIAFDATVQAWALDARDTEDVRDALSQETDRPRLPAPRAFRWWGGAGGDVDRAGEKAARALAAEEALIEVRVAAQELSAAAAALNELDDLPAAARALVALGGAAIARALELAHDSASLAKYDDALALAERMAESAAPDFGASGAHALKRAAGALGERAEGAWGRVGEARLALARTGSSAAAAKAHVKGGSAKALALVQRLQTRRCTCARRAGPIFPLIFPFPSSSPSPPPGSHAPPPTPLVPTSRRAFTRAEPRARAPARPCHARATRRYVSIPEYRYVYLLYSLASLAEAARRTWLLAAWALRGTLRVGWLARAIGIGAVVLSALLILVHLLVAFRALGGQIHGQSAEAPTANAVEKLVVRAIGGFARAARSCCAPRALPAGERAMLPAPDGRVVDAANAVAHDAVPPPQRVQPRARAGQSPTHVAPRAMKQKARAAAPVRAAAAPPDRARMAAPPPDALARLAPRQAAKISLPAARAPRRRSRTEEGEAAAGSAIERKPASAPPSRHGQGHEQEQGAADDERKLAPVQARTSSRQQPVHERALMGQDEEKEGAKRAEPGAAAPPERAALAIIQPAAMPEPGAGRPRALVDPGRARGFTLTPALRALVDALVELALAQAQTDQGADAADKLRAELVRSRGALRDALASAVSQMRAQIVEGTVDHGARASPSEDIALLDALDPWVWLLRLAELFHRAAADLDKDA